jgi:hypothetical protein
MKANVGALDKGLRIAAGVVLLGVSVFLDHPARWLGLIGIVPLATGLFGYCPLYALFGFDTCPLNKA